ncbi:MAG: cytochrome d ubiquinol oxidase subunit II [Actinobacteria bacterium]|jgi:cytochrome d ubiquinol oxidase subunit II|nr:cytochrome d ubiquinol oxidase subunit II [Actinomycetota bacterium]
MTLNEFWFILIGVLWTGFLVLEGFDFGVGGLLSTLGKGKDAADTEKRRRVMLTTIGPHWDGNEVWLLTAGGATFAAFPHWYATMFSAMYLPLLIILVALIVRAMGFEYRHKRNDDAWRRNWDLCIMAGSLLPPLLIGVALTNHVRGLPIDQDMEFVGNLFTLLNPMSLLGGIVVLLLSLTHGAFFIALKTEGEIRRDARVIGTKLGLVTAVLAVVLLLWIGLTKGTVWSWITTVIAAVALLFAIWSNTKDKEGYAFIGTAVTFAMAVATYFLVLFPNVMPSTLEGGTSLTITNASSSPLTLKIMTWAAVVFTPIVLIYTAWSYWAFRKRIGTHHIPAPVKVS